MDKPEVWTAEHLTQEHLENAVVWCSPGRLQVLLARVKVEAVESLDAIPDEATTLVVIGGGKRMDEAKVWRHEQRPDLRLIVIPSLWGSGAEASPVAVLNRDGVKDIRLGDEYLPDVRMVLPELMDTLSVDRARHGCGDAWSHALEGFLSPLADDTLRKEFANILQTMLTLPIGKDNKWFEVSARASATQAKASVGLIHGIAHTLEGPLRAAQPDAGWGHARLCSLFLLPVMAFNRQASDKFDNLMQRYGLDSESILNRVQVLFDEDDYTAVLPLMQENWKPILRDQCSRTNSALVRPKSLDFFVERGFL